MRTKIFFWNFDFEYVRPKDFAVELFQSFLLLISPRDPSEHPPGVYSKNAPEVAWGSAPGVAFGSPLGFLLKIIQKSRSCRGVPCRNIPEVFSGNSPEFPSKNPHGVPCGNTAEVLSRNPGGFFSRNPPGASCGKSSNTMAFLNP